jgi:8-oxo-dGTP pyrophosphatase MutT (NUDIX family)
VWEGRSASFAVADVVARVAAYQEVLAELPTPRTDERVSAVMILLVDGPSGAEVLLTRRTETLNNHKGEMSFPGGRVDADEGLIEAALREAWEEVGVAPSSVSVVGRLSPLSTFVSRSFIVPVVGVVASHPVLSLHEVEVDRAVWVSLRDLVRADTFSWEWWDFTGAADSVERAMFFFHLDDETVWGATARMLHELLCVVHGANHLELCNW